MSQRVRERGNACGRDGRAACLPVLARATLAALVLALFATGAKAPAAAPPFLPPKASPAPKRPAPHPDLPQPEGVARFDLAGRWQLGAGTLLLNASRGGAGLSGLGLGLQQ